MPQPYSVTAPPQTKDAAMDRWLTTVQQALQFLGQGFTYESIVPVTGFSHTIANGQGVCFLAPAAGLATGTITFPASAFDGFVQRIVSSQSVTSLTLVPNSGQTLDGLTPRALAANTEISYRWLKGPALWIQLA